MSSKKISIAHLNAAARQTAMSIARVFKDKIGEIRVYGVPRGGITAAYAVASIGMPPRGFSHMVVVDDFADCDVIVDDLIDSGATKKRYSEMCPEIPFFALFEKPKKWLVFPWEELNLSAAEDAPLRLLQFVGEDASRGGLRETPKRFLKAWQHFTSGYKEDPAKVMKVFSDGAESYDEMVLVKNIPVYSQCEHHLVPFFGVAHVAYIPNGKIVGLSKLNRVVDIFARRLQVQERLTGQVATAIEDNLTPEGVAVVLECRHLCMEARGICQQGHTTTTSAMRGVFRTDNSARMEFLNLIK